MGRESHNEKIRDLTKQWHNKNRPSRHEHNVPITELVKQRNEIIGTELLGVLEEATGSGFDELLFIEQPSGGVVGYNHSKFNVKLSEFSGLKQNRYTGPQEVGILEAELNGYARTQEASLLEAAESRDETNESPKAMSNYLGAPGADNPYKNTAES